MAFTELTTRQREIVEIGTGLFGKRSSLMSFWQEAADHFYPERGTFTRTAVLGDDYASHLMESYPVVARAELGNMFATLLRPRGQEWFQAIPASHRLREIAAVKAFCERAGNILRRVIYDARSNFVRATREADHDYVTFGNAVLSVEESRTRDGLLFSAWHLRDCVWLENAWRDVDHLHRRFVMTARAAKSRWGDKLHPETLNLCDKTPDAEIELRHIVLPMEEYGGNDIKKRNEKNRPFASLIVESERQGLLEIKGINRFPYVVLRWNLLSDSQYALSPCVMAGIADARLLQRQALTILEAGEKTVDPPMIATREAVIGGVNLQPGGISWVDADYDERLGAALRPVDLGKNVGLGLDMKQDTREMITRAFYLNRLNLPDAGDGQMTAYETRMRTQEYVRASLPLFEPVEAGYTPLLHLSTGILIDVGAINGFPEELAGEELEFQFENPLQEVAAREKAARLAEGAQLIGTMSQVDPNVREIARFPIATRDALEGLGWPQEWMNEKDVADRADELSDLQNAAQGIAGVAGSVGLAAQGVGGVVQAVRSVAGERLPPDPMGVQL